MRTDTNVLGGRGQYLSRNLEKANLLRKLCGGRLHRWLMRWRANAGTDLIPWPGWPVSRLILARYVPENSSSPFTVRFTMDTTTWPLPWRTARWPQSWRARSSRAIPGWLQDRCIAVPDTLEALHRLARAVRQQWGKKVCSITGSVGKTTTKEIVAALLGSKLRVLKTEGNFNNEYGLPLTLFRLEDSDDVAVLEMGMSFPGELKRLAAIALPDVAIETRVSPAHLLNFSSVDEIALAKRELIEGLHGRESVAVLNADDPRVAAMAKVAPGRVIFYGVENPAEFAAEQIEDRGALGSSVHPGASGPTHANGVAAAGPPRSGECPCRDCCGQPLEYWRRRRAEGVASVCALRPCGGNSFASPMDLL